MRPAVNILLRLEEHLPDETLSACFKELEPSTVRAYLKEAARVLSDLKIPSQTDSSPAVHTKTGGKFRQKIQHPSRMTLFSDGASRGNPGEAGAGILIFDEAGREVHAQGRYLGCCTNNVAEYQALLMGIQEAIRLGGEEIDIRLDSELIVRQIQGVYKVKNAKLKELFAEVKKELAKFRRYTVTHVRRENNYRADELANQAIDNRY